jgi:nicotinamidase-related amidase
MTLALVLLDLQKGIMQAPGITWEDASAPARVLDVAASLLDAAHEGGVPIVHVGVVRPHSRGAFDALRTAGSRKSGRAPRDVTPLASGSTDVAFVHAPGPTEEVVHKIGVSAFQGTRLDGLLRNVGADEVMVAGAFTHMVVESTVRQGFDLGYRMIVVEDACCASATAPHQAALAIGIPSFATIVKSDEACRMLRQRAHG